MLKEWLSKFRSSQSAELNEETIADADMEEQKEPKLTDRSKQANPFAIKNFIDILGALFA